MLGLDIAAVAHRSVPVLCIDTCSLLDIMRDPTRDDARPHERQAAVNLVPPLEMGSFICLVAEQVMLEFNAHDSNIQQQAVTQIQKLRGRVERTNEIRGYFLPPVPVNLNHLDSYIVPARGIIERWLVAAFSVASSDDIYARATGRVIRKVAPARQGKDSLQDCVVFESYLMAIRALRAAGMLSRVVFLSSNTDDYANASKILKPDLEADFTSLSISYAHNMAMARSQLGL